MSREQPISTVFKQAKRGRRRPKDSKGLLTRLSADAVEQTAASAKSDADKLQILQEFDLALEFGPCAGITRLERWERAFKHGLNPPLYVKDILITHQENEKYKHCVWNDYGI